MNIHLPSPARTAAAALALVPALCSANEWNFTALLDGKPIGTHRFVRTAEGSTGTLVSDARFDVKLLGVTVYKYRHRASERWQGDCLASIEARTDDGGKVSEVRGNADGSGRIALEVRNGDQGEPARSATPSSCMMSFAYWNPSLATQRALLDPGTGRVEAVRITPLPETKIEVAGQEAPVRGLRIAGLKQPIDVWYQGDRWVGLDTQVDGGRKLSYRLQDAR